MALCMALRKLLLYTMIQPLTYCPMVDDHTWYLNPKGRADPVLIPGHTACVYPLPVHRDTSVPGNTPQWLQWKKLMVILLEEGADHDCNLPPSHSPPLHFSPPSYPTHFSVRLAGASAQDSSLINVSQHLYKKTRISSGRRGGKKTR